MKKLFQKLLGKLIKKAVKKSVDAAVENPEILVPTTSQESAIKTKDPLWVIILKILSYIITLILGFVTSSCTGHLF